MFVLALIDSSLLISVIILAIPPPTVPQPNMAMFKVSIRMVDKKFAQDKKN
jgi:hypothetical protein